MIYLSLMTLALTAESVLSQSWLGNSGYPIVPASSYDSLTCYAQNAEGQMVDLNQLCAQNQQRSQCNAAYPDVCIPVTSTNLTCKDIPYRSFRVLSPDPYKFDRNRNQIGCESILEEFNPL